MMQAVVDVRKAAAHDAAVAEMMALHSDRVLVVEERFGRWATAVIMPALPPGAARDPDLADVSAELLGCPTWSLPLVSAWRPAGAGRPARLVAPSHTWAAVAFSRMARQGSHSVHLVHVDAHDDYAQPPPGRPLDLTNPAEVTAGVVAGRLGIGSFIRPFVDAGIIASVTQIQRPWLVTELPAPLAGEVWLDVDLDCLCNAFDDKSPEEGVDARTVGWRLEALGACVDAVVDHRPSLLTVALSPGFLPSRLWRDALSGLDEVLSRLWGDVSLPYVD